MICWADTTLPSSRVRSAALRTNLFSRSLLGRKVIGTVSGSLGFAFLCLARVASGAGSLTDAFVGGAGDTGTGAGIAVAPAGWLAAAASLAAKSLE
jgi:hypothetical protein